MRQEFARRYYRAGSRKNDHTDCARFTGLFAQCKVSLSCSMVECTLWYSDSLKTGMIVLTCLTSRIGETKRPWGEPSGRWYEVLISDACTAPFQNDYAPLLATISGEVLNVGGGIVIGQYFPRHPHRRRPSPNWLEAEMAARIFPMP